MAYSSLPASQGPWKQSSERDSKKTSLTLSTYLNPLATRIFELTHFSSPASLSSTAISPLRPSTTKNPCPRSGSMDSTRCGTLVQR